MVPVWLGIINILVPVFLPLFVLWIISIPRVTAALAAGGVIRSIGKGELFWATMGMAAATCYEVRAIEARVTDPNGKGIAWLVFGLHLLIILCSAFLVGIGSLATAPASGHPHIPDKKVFYASLWFLAFTALSYTMVHAYLNTLENEIKDKAVTEARQEKEVIMKTLRECLAKNRKDGSLCLEPRK
ncbi:hypothetical protein [Massilia sp. ST3]|uniref:hypothetical protein n=1 Tax=Massilia sp. ST3 TaxID=2824903 RepID=UPI001B81FAEA|nr:hypothetical protein [Massilia sp. ST3]MBQ5950252.1 hypothetical protein [Massilia sp. ST3]